MEIYDPEASQNPREKSSRRMDELVKYCRKFKRNWIGEKLYYVLLESTIWMNSTKWTSEQNKRKIEREVITNVLLSVRIFGCK